MMKMCFDTIFGNLFEFRVADDYDSTSVYSLLGTRSSKENGALTLRDDRLPVGEEHAGLRLLLRPSAIVCSKFRSKQTRSTQHPPVRSAEPVPSNKEQSETTDGKKQSPSIIHVTIYGGDLVIDNTNITGNTIKNEGGQLFLGRFRDVVAHLNSAGQGKEKVAAALEAAKAAIIAHAALSEDQKAEQVDVLAQIGEQATKPKPNPTILRSLGEGLKAAVASIPELANAVASVITVVGAVCS